MLCKRHCSGIEPAVDNFRYTLHSATAFITFKCNFVDIWAVQFNFGSIRIAGTLSQLGTASDGFLTSAVLTLPDVEWCSPVTVTGDTPVLNIFKPVSETSLTDGLRNPVYGLVVGNEVITNLCHLDEPGLSCIVDEWCVTSPAVWILVLKLRSIV